MNTIRDAKLVIVEGAQPKAFSGLLWQVVAVMAGHMPEHAGWLHAHLDQRSGVVMFAITPEGKKRSKLVDGPTALDSLRASLPPRRMAVMCKAVEDALLDAIQSNR